MIRIMFTIILLALPLSAAPETPQAIATVILAPLLEPAKVATLKGDRSANARLYKVLFWLEIARERGGNVSAVIGTAQASAGYAGTPGAEADKQAITWPSINPAVPELSRGCVL